MLMQLSRTNGNDGTATIDANATVANTGNDDIAMIGANATATESHETELHSCATVSHVYSASGVAARTRHLEIATIVASVHDLIFRQEGFQRVFHCLYFKLLSTFNVRIRAG